MFRICFIILFFLIGASFASAQDSITIIIKSKATQEANRLYKDKKYNEALVQIKTAIAEKDTSAFAYFLRGLIYSELSKYKEAIADFDKALIIDPLLIQAVNGKIEVYKKQKNDNKALDAYQEAIKIEPTNSLLYYNSGVLLAEMNRKEEAEVAISKAIEIKSDDPRYLLARATINYEIGNYEKSLIDLNQLIKVNKKVASKDKNFGIEAYIYRGNIHFEMNNHQEAVSDYSIVLEAMPNKPDILFNRGNSYIFLGDYKKAIPDFTQYINIDKQNLDAYVSRGYSYQQSGDLQKAISDYSYVLNLNKVDTLALYNRASVYYQLEQYDKAISDYTSLISINSKNSEIFFSRGIVYFNKKMYNQAKNDFAKAIELGDVLPEAYLNKAVSEEMLQDYKNSISDYKKYLNEIEKNGTSSNIEQIKKKIVQLEAKISDK